MRAKSKQRVRCLACSWSGGRAAGPEVASRPCFKCGGAVEPVGEVYEESRVWAGCAGCSWYGEIAPDRVGGACSKCGQPTAAAYVVLADGQVLS